MTTEVERVPFAVRATALSPLRVTSFDQAKSMAEFLAKAQIVPEAYRGKPADIVVAIGMGAEIGLGPFQSLQSIYVVHGRPSLYVEAALAIVLASGLLEHYSVESTDTEASATVQRRGVAEPVSIRFTLEDAKKLGLTANPSWAKQARWMLEMRATGRVLHRLFPDLLKGLGLLDAAGPVEQPAVSAVLDVKDRLREKLGRAAEEAERPRPEPGPDPAPEPAPEPEPEEEPAPTPAAAGPSDGELTLMRSRILHDMNTLGLTPAMQTILVKRHAGVPTLGALGQATLDGLIALQDELEAQKRARRHPHSAA
jgi:hypothetical protein